MDMMELGFLEDEGDGTLATRKRTNDWRDWDGGLLGDFVPLRPGHGTTTCSQCGAALCPLLQLYAPLDDVPEAFHRDLYVLLCRTPECPQRATVCRQQLPRVNPWYPSAEPSTDDAATTVPDRSDWWPGLAPRACDKPMGIKIHNGDDDDDDSTASPASEDSSDEEEARTCAVCMCECTARCSKCKSVYYCSPQHQRQDWREHKLVCDDLALSQAELNETLSMGRASVYGKLAAAHDAQFERFKHVIRTAPRQVVRYNRWSPRSAPLWIATSQRMTGNPPPCEGCGAQRAFEFQVLPQILNACPRGPEFGTLAVYTCTKSCDASSVEFAYHQPGQ